MRGGEGVSRVPGESLGYWALGPLAQEERCLHRGEEVPTEQGTLAGDVLKQGGHWHGVCSDRETGQRTGQGYLCDTLDELWLVQGWEEGCARQI